MKITLNLPDNIFKNFKDNIIYYITNTLYKYNRFKDIKHKNRIKNINNTWTSYFEKNYEDLLVTLKISVKKDGFLKYIITNNNDIVGTLYKIPFLNKYFRYRINIDIISKTLLDKLAINITSNIITLKTGDGKFISSAFIGYEYLKNEDVLTIHTACGSFKFPVRRFESVITYILSILKSKLEKGYIHEKENRKS